MILSIRKTKPDDLPEVMQVYETARCFMKQTGNPSQWGDSYPSTEVIKRDIENGRSFVCLNESDGIVAVFYFQMEEADPTYLKIVDGDWLNDEKYGVIHRIASSGKEKGVMNAVIQFCFNKINNIRIDTHRDNEVMQKILKKLDFQYCGIIFLENGDERLAYQKM